MKRFLGAGAWLFAGIMLGRVLGLIRDLMITNQFGTSVDADRAVFVITIPDVMINILIGGAMGAALIPEFKRRNAEENWELLKQSSGLVFSVMFLVTGILAAFAEPITRTLVAGLPEESVLGTVRLVQICLWAVPITAVSAVVRANLQSHERFAVPSLAGFFYNLAIVAGLWIAGNEQNLRWLAFAAVLGAALSLGMQFWDVRRFKPSGSVVVGRQVDRGLVLRFAGALLAGSMILVVPVALRAFASTNGVGGQTLVYLASKLVELPMGTLLSVVSIAMFPAIAAALAKENGREEATQFAQQGLSVILALSLPIALGMGLFSVHFSKLLYWHGDMSEIGAIQIGGLTTVMMIGLVPQALNTMLLSIFNGLRDMKTPFLIGLFGLLGVLILGFLGTTNLNSLAWVYVGFHWAVLIALLVALGLKHGIWLVDGDFAARTALRIVASGAVFMLIFLPPFVGWQDTDKPFWGVVTAILLGGISLISGLVVDHQVRNQVKGVILRKLGRKA